MAQNSAVLVFPPTLIEIPEKPRSASGLNQSWRGQKWVLESPASPSFSESRRDPCWCLQEKGSHSGFGSCQSIYKPEQSCCKGNAFNSCSQLRAAGSVEIPVVTSALKGRPSVSNGSRPWPGSVREPGSWSLPVGRWRGCVWPAVGLDAVFLPISFVSAWALGMQVQIKPLKQVILPYNLNSKMKELRNFPQWRLYTKINLPA